MRFIPNLFRLVGKRILQNAIDEKTQQRKENLYYFVLPDTPEVAGMMIPGSAVARVAEWETSKPLEAI